MANTKFIEELRIQHGYTQKQLASKLGYDSTATYNRKIKGTRDFTIADITNLCKLFQVELSDLIIM